MAHTKKKTLSRQTLILIVSAVMLLAGLCVFFLTRNNASDTSATTLTRTGDMTPTHTAVIEIENYGTLHVELYGKEAPITVANFVKLAESGFYDDTVFHRIIDGFMAQGGGYDKTGGDVIAKYYLANRVAGERVNYPGKIDWYSVSSFTAKMDRDTKDFCDYIDETIKTQGWGVQMNYWITDKNEDVHHSQRKPTFIEECYYLADRVNEGLVKVVSFEEAVLYLRKAEMTTLEIEGNTIRLKSKADAFHLRDVPLTIAINSDTPLKITENGVTTTYPSQNGIVLAKIVNQGTIE